VHYAVKSNTEIDYLSVPPSPQPERQRLTIVDVARHAGVSTATVSRVLNDSQTVKADNRQAVLQAMSELDYRPNRLAANLRRQQAQMIGVLVSDIENPHFTEMVRAVEDEAYRRGHRVLLCNTDERADKQRDYLNVLAAERVIGVILSPTDPAAPEIRELLDLDIPLVAFDREVDDPRAGSVTADNRDGARRATQHLIDLGHRDIAFLGGPDTAQTGRERRLGYEDAIAQAGLVSHFRSGQFRIAPAREATTKLLAEDPPTAIVAGNNLMSIGVLQALRAAGRRVPDDIALVSIDDPFWAALTEPPLTALAQPVATMAETAVELLLGGIEQHAAVSRKVVYDMELKVRGSCGGGGDAP
jgi:DNA-binding LacI/PurR family transcriptional regulator